MCEDFAKHIAVNVLDTLHDGLGGVVLPVADTAVVSGQIPRMARRRAFRPAFSSSVQVGSSGHQL